MKIGVVSLGCDKNRVDTEKMLARLLEGGHEFCSDESQADVIIINTCAFTLDAKNESIDEILRAVEEKKERGAKVIVTGCLPQRYGKELSDSLPEVDGFFGTADYDALKVEIDNIAGGERRSVICGEDKYTVKREITTPYHYAYLKIADGCDNHCTYCAIPKIRGRYRSYKEDDLLNEAQELYDQGVKELILIAQDVTRYGIDIYGKPQLLKLLDLLTKIDFKWIRLLYLEPEVVSDELINYIKQNPKVANYMDIPFQHVDSSVLKRMGRHTDEKLTKELAEKVLSSGIALRSSFITGFPGEGESEFEKLYDFINNYKIDYAGFFAYSREEGTPADKLDGHLNERVKELRRKKLYKIQTAVMKEKAAAKMGQTLTVLAEGIDYDRQMFYGRSQFQAPGIDTLIYFTSEGLVNAGDFYEVEILSSDGIDLIGRAK